MWSKEKNSLPRKKLDEILPGMCENPHASVFEGLMDFSNTNKFIILYSMKMGGCGILHKSAQQNS